MKSHNKCGLCKVEINSLTVKDGKNIIIEDITTTLSCGQLTAIIGKNGAGKTTLIKAILGERQHSGFITYKDHNNNEHPNPKIGYVPQQLSFDKSSPVSVLDFALSCISKNPVWLFHSKNEVKSVTERLCKFKCQDIIDRRLGDISGGELQRLLLAVAIEPMPDMLVLDEPVSGVDTAGLDIFYEIVTSIRDNFHIPILLVSHDLALVAKYADNVLLIDKTIIKQGSANEVFSSESFKSTFGLKEVVK